MDTKDALRKKGLKATPVRVAALDLFSGHCVPISAEVLCKKLRSKDINIVTAYRTLAAFEKAGFIKRVDLHRDAVFYERADHHHHHIVCTRCGDVESLGLCAVPDITRSAVLQSSKFSIINDHSLEFFGVCTKCN